MAQRNAAEVAAGAVILAVALGFLGYGMAQTGRGTVGGVTLHAKFNAIDGLGVGSDVRIAGVKVGSITSEQLDPKSYQADVAFTVAHGIAVPKDSSAAVTSDGLLGGKYLAIEPGADDQMLADGGTITITQSSVSIEQLLGKFIFSMAPSDKAQGAKKPGEAGAPAAAPGSAPQ
jgi:phospholipid/cholesterol/gamma-HCH transport system substrate-binding protein